MGWPQILFGFNGRIRRTTYWLSPLAAGALFVVAAFCVGAAWGISHAEEAAAGPIPTSDLLVELIPAYAVVAWIALALGVKRCHDRNYPGALVLLSVVPVVGSLWALIDLGFIDGTPGPNRYGPSPKGVAAPSLSPAMPRAPSPPAAPASQQAGGAAADW